MNFQQLEYVLAVHRHKHFGQAAENCHITQATLSAMIKKLEAELDVMLFDRSRQPVQTTEAGLKFIALANEIILKRNQLFTIKEETTKALEGEITLGVIPTIANSLLPIILPAILTENPKLKLKVVEITTEEIIQHLNLDKIDMGILATPLQEDYLEETILYYEAMMVYGIKGKAQKYVSTKDIKSGKIWLLEEGHCFRNQMMTICDIREKNQDATSNLNFEGNSFETLLNLSDRFGGYTLVPELYFNEMPKKKQNLTKSFQTPIPVREISLVTARPYAKKMAVDYLSNRIRELVAPLLSTTQMANKDLEIIGI